MRNYILEGKTPKLVNDVLEWAKWFETADRIVKKTAIGDSCVSTVFIGCDHSFDGGYPLLFETMIFGGENDGYQKRYSAWREAENGHEKAIRIIKGDEIINEIL